MSSSPHHASSSSSCHAHSTSDNFSAGVHLSPPPPQPALKWIAHHESTVIPTIPETDDAGIDIVCPETVTINPSGAINPETSKPFGAQKINTHLGIVLPEGYYVDVRPRSSTAHKYGLHVVLGTGDSNYRGPYYITVFNHSHFPVTLPAGTSIAQFVLHKKVYLDADPRIHVVYGPHGDRSILESTTRGVNGHGSTGPAGNSRGTKKRVRTPVPPTTTPDPAAPLPLSSALMDGKKDGTTNNVSDL